MLKNKLFTRVLAIVALIAFLGVAILASLPSSMAHAASVQDAQRKQKEATAKKEDRKSVV